MAGDGDVADREGEDDGAYRTVETRGRSAFSVRGSEFLGHVAPASDVEAAEAFVGSVRGEYDDATHNVPAYRVRADPFREYGDDDGEPTGSAAKPILNVLSGQEVENVVCVVTRYYGGTNLGVGGLVKAYGRATKEALADAGVVTERPHERLRVTVDYDDSGLVRGILEPAATGFDATYRERVTFEARVPVSEAPALRDRVRSATSGRAELG
jgi:uncharacterized YigZ family protein